MLLIGYGNPGRGDDGLGPAFAERIARARLPGVEVSVDYQLSVDHVLPVSTADRVVIADAEIGLAAPYRLLSLAPSERGDLMSHSLSPGEVLALARLLYGRAPKAYLLGIAGIEFGAIREGLSAEALANLARAERFFVDWAGRGFGDASTHPRAAAAELGGDRNHASRPARGQRFGQVPGYDD